MIQSIRMFRNQCVKETLQAYCLVEIHSVAAAAQFCVTQARINGCLGTRYVRIL